MFKRNTNLTPSQRANKAMMSIVARLGGCGFLIYFTVKMLTLPPEERPDPTAGLIIGIVFILAAAIFLFLTVQELWVSYKTGRFKASTYEDQDLAEYMAERAESSDAESSDSKSEDDKAEDEDDSEDDQENKE